MKKILFLGAGNMGGAILEGALHSGVLKPENIFISDPNAERVEFLQKKLGVHVGNPGDANIIFLGVKPQIVEKVFPLEHAKGALLISILAGVESEKLQNISGIQKICRVMPNTPAMVGEGISALFYSSQVEKTEKDFCAHLFSGCGKIVEITHEDQMHAITAVSGSGPAYFFRFVEEIIKAGENLGLEKKSALQLATQTFIGAAQLLKETGEKPETLRKNVTSPGGTTAAALEKFTEKKLGEVVEKGLKAAAEKSKDLGKSPL